MRRPLPALALFALAAGLTASAQPPAATVTKTVAGSAIPATKLGDPIPPPREAGAKAGEKAGDKDEKPAPKAEPPKESPRLAKLKQLTFDRRPSAVLKAWAPAKPKADRPAAAARPPQPQPQPGGPDGPDGPGGAPAAGGLDPAKAEALEKELAEFQKKVTLGDWAGVKAYLASLPDEESIAAYRQLLRSLQQRPMPQGMSMPPGGEIDPEMMMQMQAQQGPAQQFAERNTFVADDFLGLAGAAPAGPNPAEFPGRVAALGGVAAAYAAPAGLTKEHLQPLAAIFRELVAGGTLSEVAVGRLKAEVAKPDGKAVVTRRQVAKVLTLANQAEYAGDFLPTADEAMKAADGEALNLLARHFVALHAKEAKGGNLEKAWTAVQAVLANPFGDPEEKEEGLLRAVELAPRLKDTFGQEWLDASFTKNPDRGMEILAAVGTLVSRGISTRPMAADDRLNSLKLMKTAVEALLKAAPDKAKGWSQTLTLLAAGWQKEADFSQKYDRNAGGGPRLRRDVYGNIFFGADDEEDPFQRMMQRQGGMPQPVPVADVMKAAPTPAWVAAVDDGFRPKLADAVARLHLKANEEDKAFPLIEQMAAAQPEQAKELVKEFLRVWTKNHDPNASRNQNRYSWFFFAFEQRAESIPLTRSKQERNLQELAKWSARIQKLPAGVGDLDDQLMVKAFTACHSSAEVYRTEAIEAVFGPMGGLKPKTLAGLADQMRANLAGLWKDPAEQQRKKTNRKKKDIEAEVKAGYQVALSVVADGLKKFPDNWAVLAARAGLLHDEVNYLQELQKSADFSARRGEALGVYQQAATSYAKAVRGLPEPEQTTEVYESWFAAGLGAVDLGMITEEKQPDWKQPPLIKKSLEALPGELAEKHLAKFANNLFIKMSGAKPHVKFNYLKAGFEVVGDHPRAAEAKKVFDYYKDLVTEIKLDAKVDGPTKVGHGRAFGLFVNLRHTRDIERESGGFGRYLQNQNSGGYYFYNYGRPTADYRDRFEQAARAALKEQFEVVSVTFQDEKVTSRAVPGQFGWRFTPYAYVLLKPRGPQVDKVPPLRLDLDFLDTSGYVVMPVETPAVPIDAGDKSGDPRPVEKLTVTQILDERQADKGVLILEVKAVGLGVVPELAELIDPAFSNFEVTKTDDPGVGVKKFDEDAEQNLVVCERTWTLTLKGKDGQAALPTTFRFPSVKVPTKETLYQRYVDADLVAVNQDAELEQKYGAVSNRWKWYAGAAAVAGLGLLGGLVWVLTRRSTGPVVEGLPSDPDAFVTAALLREVRDRPELTPAQRAEVDQDVAAVEQYYFSADRNGTPAPDLRRLVSKWSAAVPKRTPVGAA